MDLSAKGSDPLHAMAWGLAAVTAIIAGILIGSRDCATSIPRLLPMPVQLFLPVSGQLPLRHVASPASHTALRAMRLADLSNSQKAAFERGFPGPHCLEQRSVARFFVRRFYLRWTAHWFLAWGRRARGHHISTVL